MAAAGGSDELQQLLTEPGVVVMAADMIAANADSIQRNIGAGMTAGRPPGQAVSAHAASSKLMPVNKRLCRGAALRREKANMERPVLSMAGNDMPATYGSMIWVSRT